MAVQVNSKPIKLIIESNENATDASITPITALNEAINSISPYNKGRLESLLSSSNLPKSKNPNSRWIPYINKDTKKLAYKKGLVAQLTPVNVIFNPPATIVFWEDGEKTVVKCGEGEVFDKEKGLAMAFCKRVWGNKGRFNTMFEKWCFDEE